MFEQRTFTELTQRFLSGTTKRNNNNEHYLSYQLLPSIESIALKLLY